MKQRNRVLAMVCALMSLLMLYRVCLSVAGPRIEAALQHTSMSHPLWYKSSRAGHLAVEQLVVRGYFPAFAYARGSLARQSIENKRYNNLKDPDGFRSAFKLCKIGIEPIAKRIANPALITSGVSPVFQRRETKDMIKTALDERIGPSTRGPVRVKGLCGWESSYLLFSIVPLLGVFLAGERTIAMRSGRRKTLVSPVCSADSLAAHCRCVGNARIPHAA